MTLEVQAIQMDGWVRIKATVYSVEMGRYGSTMAATLDLARGVIPRDPEETLAMLLTSLHEVVYHR